MTDTPELEWDHWQLAWRSEPPAAARTSRTAELQRRLRRHRRLAWAYTVFDVLAANALIYGAIALLLVPWWRWYRGRLGRERAQLDALCREPEPPDAPVLPGDSGPGRDVPRS